MKDEIKEFFKGEILDDEETLLEYSHDTSLFEVMPKLVVYPKDSDDLKKLVRYVGENKKKNPELSLTIRSAGTCMSGGSLNESIIADVTKHLNNIGEVGEEVEVEPGAYYRDFEEKTLEKGLVLPCYPASKNLCALGGMIGNNCAGEKTLRWGKMENFVLETRVIFSNGKEYEVKPLTPNELEKKMSQMDFEGDVYKKLFELIQKNHQLIEDEMPRVSKNSAGYYLWNVWNGKTFDLNKLIVGSQGTLGLVTKAKIRLVPVEPVSKLFVVFLPNLSKLTLIVNTILPTNPDSIESYDDSTLKLAARFAPEMLHTMKPKNFLKLLLSFIPESIMVLKGGLPKMVLMVEYSGKTEEEVDQKLTNLEDKLRSFKYEMRKTESQEEAEKYWTVRRESFNLLRKHTEGRRTAPFIDDVVVLPEHMPKFLPEMRAILDKYKLTYTIAGHAGNGNFHIIPLMDMRNEKNKEVIQKVSEEVYSLVGKYNGSITGEHNDGIVRTPYLGKMYSKQMLKLFEETKKIFDPENIFNPGKKVRGTLEYLENHLVDKQ